jgi:PTS system nitrogen regulatory IIA component
MKISNILNNDCIFLGTEASSKRQLLQELAAKASATAKIDERTIFETLLERENLGSTGFGNGTALPHARLAEADKVMAFFAKLESPIDFDSVDGKPVDLLIMLLSPEDSGADHLTALALASRLLKDEDLSNKIRQASSASEIYAMLNQ